MNKKRISVLALLMTVIMLFTLTLVACDKTKDDPKVDTPNDIEATEGLLIPNSDFKVINVDKENPDNNKLYPRYVTDWTGAKMYSSGSYPDDVIAGAISLEKDKYDKNKSKWNDKNSALYGKLTKDHKVVKDNSNALMIYMPEEGTSIGDQDAEYGPTAYGYTSKSFSVDKLSYYKLSIDVLTYNIKGVYNDEKELTNEPGARIYLATNTHAEFDRIDTKGEWQTYEIFIEGSTLASNSLTVQLGLGKRTSSYTKGLTTGYAFFDNVNLEKLEKEEDGTFPEQVFQNAVTAEKSNNEFIQTTTLQVPNGRFDYGTTTLSSSASPLNWSTQTGKTTDDDTAPSSLGYNGVVDISDFIENYEDYAKSYHVSINNKHPEGTINPAKAFEGNVQNIGDVNGVGKNVYMLSQQLMTAQGIKSSKQITFRKNQIYALSVDVYTYDIRGEGVSLILTGADGKDIKIKGISNNKSNAVYIAGKNISDSSSNIGRTNGSWETYTFYVQGNQYKDYSYNLNLWLGTGGKTENHEFTYKKYTSSSSSATGNDAITYKANGTFATGWAFFDNVELKKINSIPSTSNVYQANGDKYTLDCTVSGNDGSKNSIAVNLETENIFANTSISSDFAPNNTGTSTDYDNQTLGTPKGFTPIFDDENSAPYVSPDFINAGIVSLANGSDFEKFGVDHPKTPYGIEKEYALMMQASKNGYFKFETDEFTIAPNNFYRLSMWVKTEDIRSTSGIYVALIDGEDEKSSFAKINTSDYDETTNDWVELTFVIRGDSDDYKDLKLSFSLGNGTRWDAATLATGACFVTNMSLTSIEYKNFTDAKTGTYTKSVNFATDYTSTVPNGSFNNYDLEDENLNDEGKFINKAGIPKDWSISDSKLEDDDNLVTGIVEMNSNDGLVFTRSSQINNVFGSDANQFDNLYGNPNDADYFDNSERIGGPRMLALAGLNGNKYSIGYASNNISLSAGKIYKLNVWVKTMKNTKGCIYLSGESNGTTYFQDNPYFKVINSTNTDWTNYTFYVEVGLTSVSVKLNLWLGYNSEYVNVPGADEDEIATNSKASGIMLFDSIGLNEIEKADFDDLTKDSIKDSERKISFLADGFDSIYASEESKNKLSKAEGWTNTEDEDQNDENTKHGVIFADEQSLELDETNTYVKILGKDLNRDEIKIGHEEVEKARTLPEYADKKDDKDAIVEALKDKKYAEQKAKYWMPISELKTPDGSNRMLIINNTEDSAYVYSSGSMTMDGDRYYKVSVWARTYKVADEKGAYIELYLGTANEADSPFIFKSVNTDEWTQYNFYVATQEESVSSIKLKLSLGKFYGSEDTLASGYAMFDNVEIKAIEHEEYLNATKNDTTLIREVSEKDTEGSTDGEDNTQTPEDKSNFNLEYLWWMIPTILLALVTIAVIITFFIKKFKKPKKAKFILDEDETSDALDEKRSNYDKNKE